MPKINVVDLNQDFDRCSWTAKNRSRRKNPNWKSVERSTACRCSNTEKKTSRRVLAIGDSFTEGDGAVVDSCYPVLLGKFLNSPNDSTGYEILNAGTCGSDPVYGYQNLQDRLCNYRPDVVLQTI